MNAGTPIIRIQNLNDSSKEFNYYSGDLPERFRVRRGDVLLSWSGTPGTSFGCFRWEGLDGWLNQHIFNVRLNPELIQPDYFVLHVNAILSELIGKAHGGVGLRHITKGQLDKIELSVPSLEVQNRIVDLLSRAANIVRMRRDAEQKAKEIIPALFLDMFGDLQSNAQRWPVKNLAEVTFFQEGPGIMAVDFRETGVPLVRLAGLQGSRVSLKGCNYLDAEKVAKRWSQFQLVKEDILVLTSATFGSPAVVDAEAEGAIFYTGIIRFRPTIDTLSRTYLRAYLGSPWFLQQARMLASGSVIKHFGPSHLRKMLIPVPSVEAQDKFAECIPMMEALVSTQSVATNQSEAIFRSLVAIVFHQ